MVLRSARAKRALGAPLLTVFIVCLGSIKDIVFIVVSSDYFFNILIVLAEFDQTLAQLIHFVAGGTFLAGFFN